MRPKTDGGLAENQTGAQDANIRWSDDRFIYAAILMSASETSRIS